MKPDRLDVLMARSRERYELKVKADWRYPQFFNFLQISPSYRLAHLIAVGKIDKNSVRLPQDFATVEKTYNTFGNVWRTDFWDWWLNCAQYQFGISVTPAVHTIAALKVREGVSANEVSKANAKLEQYLLADRLPEGMPASLIVAVPLHGDRKEVIKQFSEVLDAHYSAAKHQSGIATYQVTRNKIREATLKNAMRVLRARAALPNKPLFVVGNKSKISPAYETDENKKLRNDERRRLMEILTSRQLQRAYLLSEHAARGVFPSIDKLPEDEARPSFDYVVLQRQLKSYIKWLETELAKKKSKLKSKQRKVELL